jgi:hypothetical protein
MTRKAAEKSKEPLSPTAKRKLEVLKKQKEDQKTKQYLTHDFAYTGIPGATATAKGVKYKAKKGKFGAIKLPKKPSNYAGGGSAQRGFGRAFLKGGKV